MPQKPIDYDALARQTGGKPAPVDYDALARESGAEVFLSMPSKSSTPADTGGIGGFAREFWKRTNPIETIKGIASMTQGANLLNIVKSDPEFLTQAHEAAKGGDYIKATRKLLSYLSMGLGHELDTQADLMDQGRYAEGAGAMAGTAANLVLPAKAAEVLGGARIAHSDPAVVRAVQTGRAAGVPIDAATATGNKFVQFAQKTADESLVGSVVGQRARTAQQAGLTKMGEDLSARVNPARVSPQQAGEVAQAGGRTAVHDARGAANDAYDRLRAIESDPANTATFQSDVGTPGPNAPAFFTSKLRATVEEVFTEALKDARTNGYRGTAGELRTMFNSRVAQAKALKEVSAEGQEYGHAALLKEIRSRGGLRPFDRDFNPGAPTSKLRGDFHASQDALKNNYGANAVYRNDGLALDDMLQQLSEDPKWSAVITPDTDLLGLIQQGGMKPKTTIPPRDVQYGLKDVGVEPGAQWWNEGAPAQRVPMAVDLTPTKAAMQPIYDKLAAEAKLVPLMGSKAQAYTKLDALLNGPDFAPLSVADAALSDLKAMARSKNPDLRNAGQGIAAKTVGELHKSVMEAAQRAGPDAVAALTEGRQATIAKYAAADILKRLEGAQGTKSPVTAFRGMTQAGDTSLGQLHEVIAQTPGTKPLIGRAVLDGLVDSPTMGPDASFKAWQRVGPQTKALLYTPEHIKALDDFFLLRKKIAENPNPSGSGLTMLKGGELYMREPALTIGLPLLSAFLHSPAGVRILTEGFRAPSVMARAGWAAKVRQFSAAQGVALTTQSGEAR